MGWQQEGGAESGTVMLSMAAMQTGMKGGGARPQDVCAADAGGVQRGDNAAATFE